MCFVNSMIISKIVTIIILLLMERFVFKMYIYTA